MNLPDIQSTPVVNLSHIQPLPEENLETFVGAHLVTDLTQQLNDVSRSMKEDLEIKQGLRTEIAELQNLETQTTSVIENGETFRHLNEEQMTKLGYPESATTFEDEASGETLYKISEEDFDTARKNAIGQREETLSQMNSQGELTMLEIQSLVEQRKQALTLLSNLLAASNQIAQTIIGNIRN